MWLRDAPARWSSILDACNRVQLDGGDVLVQVAQEQMVDSLWNSASIHFGGESVPGVPSATVFCSRSSDSRDHRSSRMSTSDSLLALAEGEDPTEVRSHGVGN